MPFHPDPHLPSPQGGFLRHSAQRSVSAHNVFPLRTPTVALAVGAGVKPPPTVARGSWLEARIYKIIMRCIDRRITRDAA